MRRLIAFAILYACSTTLVFGENMPKGFVHLKTIDNTIAQDIRYALGNNFIGRRLDGYLASECVLALPVAKALSKAQKRLKPRGLTLLVYDCYRPARAVRDMAQSVRKSGKTNSRHHPKIPANLLIKKGYVASRSGHSSGGSIDLTLARVEDGKIVSLDMGTRFDYFDPTSHTRSSKVSKQARKNRGLLVEIMAQAGFSNYRKEWWHFRFKKEPYPGRHFNFPITSP